MVTFVKRRQLSARWSSRVVTTTLRWTSVSSKRRRAVLKSSAESKVDDGQVEQEDVAPGEEDQEDAADPEEMLRPAERSSWKGCSAPSLPWSRCGSS